MSDLRVGVVGCGMISDIYLKNLRFLVRGVEVVRLAGRDPERTRAKARKHGIEAWGSVDELLADKNVDAVLNLTVPLAHAEISMRALRAGKHVYTEKPLAVGLEEGLGLVDEARKRSLYIGCAPDTFLGRGLQACVAAIRSGAIGDIVGASAFMLNHGPEAWHRDPAFFYQAGGGPLLDIGPYYFTALTAMLGPASGIVGAARSSFPERIVGSGPKKGERIRVEVPTHATGAIEFESGAIATYAMSFDVWHSSLPRIEVYGSEGSLIVPDPNTFSGPVLLRLAGEAEWKELPLEGPFGVDSRGLGLAEMASSIAAGRPCRASGRLALHVLEMMLGAEASAREGRRVAFALGLPAPEPLGAAEAMSLSR
jgi:predicted dehydrogenase